jgi:cation-transporting ATPase 13A3/4/5
MTYQKALGIPRGEIECGLTFLGLLVMENKLKVQTAGVIANLQECKIRTVMATGDNVLTAISVARQCNIIDSSKDVWLADVGTVDGKTSLVWKSTNKEMNQKATNMPENQLPWDYKDESIEVAITGKAFKQICDLREVNPYVLSSVVAKAKVFARMGPDDKAALVENI